MKPELSVAAPRQTQPFTHRQYLILAFPLIVSTLSTPILGAVDTAVIGRMSDPSYIGGVAVGALIFNTMYWLLGFLRVSTTGFTAQAHGANNEQEKAVSFLRPMFIAILFGLLFIAAQYPIMKLAALLLGTTDAVTEKASVYFYIRIWGAPFTLLNYVMIGWLMGMSKVRLSLAAQIFMNVLNITLDFLFVIGFGLGVAGVATATLISEISACVLGAWIIIRTRQIKRSDISIGALLESSSLVKMLKTNRDLFLRTACLLTMTCIFTAKGASLGEVVLAANAILLQIHYLMAYLLSGFANASSIIVGRAIGGRNEPLYQRAFSLSAQWGVYAAIGLAICLLLFVGPFLSLFTTIDEVKSTASEYIVWMLLYPLAGFWGLQLEGIFSGATEARSIRDSIMTSLVIYLIAVWLFIPQFGNHGVWLSFILFSVSRSLFLWRYVPKLTRSLFRGNFNT
ncbi:MATE family efflux transporter [Paenibacillus tarimensis]